jgi:hypothetical protein
LKNAADSAGLSLDYVDSETYSRNASLPEMNEVGLMKIFAAKNEFLQSALDMFSRQSLPEDLQVHVDQLIATFATPISEEAMTDAHSLDA